jgi:hypothetical protein
LAAETEHPQVNHRLCRDSASFSSEVDAGLREENALKQESKVGSD